MIVIPTELIPHRKNVDLHDIGHNVSRNNFFAIIDAYQEYVNNRNKYIRSNKILISLLSG